MPFLSLGPGWGDQFEVSEFALAAHEGNILLLEKLLRENSELTKDTMALYLALRSGRKDVFSWLVKNKSVITDSFYTYILYLDPDFLTLVPPNEEALVLAQCRQVSLQLAEGLIRNKLSLEEVRKLIYAGADATRGLHVVKGCVDYFPIHLAAIHPHLAIFKEIVRAGGDPKPSCPDGRNACRMVYENTTLTRAKRKAFREYFKQTKVNPVPPLSLMNKLRLLINLPVLLLLLFPLLAFSQTKAPIESLFSDLPTEEKIEKRMELIEDIRSGKEKNYLLPESSVLYALNVKDNPKHGPSWYGWIQNTLAAGNLGQMRYSKETLKKAETMLRMAQRKVPDHTGLKLLKIKINFAKGVEDYKIKPELDKFKAKADSIDFYDLYFMTELYTKLGDSYSASEIFKLMEGKASGDAELVMCYQGRGQSARRSGNWNDCVHAYKKSDELFPNNQYVILSIVQCLNSGNRFTEALQYSERLKEGGDASCAIADALIGRGAEIGRGGNLKEAEEFINKSFKCAKWEAYHELTNIRIKQLNFDSAYEMMMKSSDIRGPDKKAAYLKAWSSSFRQNPDIYKKIMTNVIDSESNPEEKLQAYFELSKFLFQSNDSGAKDLSEKGITFGTNSLNAYAESYPFLKSLAGLLALQGLHLKNAAAQEQAQLLLGKLSMMNPNDPDLQVSPKKNQGPAPVVVVPPSATTIEPVPAQEPVQTTPAKPQLTPTQSAYPTPAAIQSVPSQATPTQPAYDQPAPIQSAPVQAIPSQPAGTAPIPVQ